MNAPASLLTPTQEEVQSFRIVVSMRSLVMGVLEARSSGEKAQTNALHAFLLATTDMEKVQTLLDDVLDGSKDATLKARVSELRAVYQASMTVDFPATLSYPACLSLARKTLTELGIMPNGKPKRTQAQIDATVKGKAIGKMIADGLTLEEAGEQWGHSQGCLSDDARIVDEEATRVLTQYGHGLAGAIAKSILKTIKEG